MKSHFASTTAFIFSVLFSGASSFTIVTPAASTHSSICSSSTSNTNLQMGLFDFFSEDARKEREAKRQAEIEEQERLQQEILARRSNPKKMEEYEARVRVRRNLRMSGEDEAAKMVKIYDDEEGAEE